MLSSSSSSRSPSPSLSVSSTGTPHGVDPPPPPSTTTVKGGGGGGGGGESTVPASVAVQVVVPSQHDKTSTTSNNTSQTSPVKESGSTLSSNPFLSLWDKIFHSPITPWTYKVTGYLRIYMGLIFLYDHFLWGYDREWLQSPTKGVLPPTEAFLDDTTLWTTHYFGYLFGIGLILGIYPRLCALGVFRTLTSFQSAYFPFGTDMQDDLLRIWSFYFLFLPLDSMTIYDVIRWWKRRSRDQSRIGGIEDQTTGGGDAVTRTWTMWPYRIAQFQLFCVYVGCAYGKLLVSDSWVVGLELWRAMHEHVFCHSGLFQPDWLLNTLVPLKVLTWQTLVLEHVILITMWPTSTRKATIITMIIFHLGIDITMNMHIFQYVSILGWFFLLAEPNYNNDNNEVKKDVKEVTMDAASGVGKKTPERTTTTSNSSRIPVPQSRVSRLLRRMLIDPFIVTWILVTWAQCNMGEHVFKALNSPPWNVNIYMYDKVRTVLTPLVVAHNTVMDWVEEFAEPYIGAIGCDQSPWMIFKGSSRSTAPGFRFYARIEYVVVESKRTDDVATNEDDGSEEVDVTSTDSADDEGVSYVYKTMVWATPDWSTMPWWVQKRYQRAMLYYENLADFGKVIGLPFNWALYGAYDGSERAGKHSIIPGSIIYGEQEYTDLVNERGPDVQIVSILLLKAHHSGPLFPPEDLGGWDVPAVVRDPELTVYSVVNYFTPEEDYLDKLTCLERYQSGECFKWLENTRFMWDECPLTCSAKGAFNKAVLVRPGSEIFADGRDFTVLEQLDDGRFDYEEDGTGERLRGDLFRLRYDLVPTEGDDDVDYDDENHPLNGYFTAFEYAVN